MRIARSISLLLVAFALPVQPVCYYPNGDASNQDVPCNDGDDESTCCGPGLACLGNNLCMATGVGIQSPTMKSTYVRGTCTDRSWRSGNCPNFCINDEVDRLDQGMPIEKCPANKDNDDDDGEEEGGKEELYYCVNKRKPDCANRHNVLVFEGPASTITTIGVAPSSTRVSTTESTTETRMEAPASDPSEDTASGSSRSSEPSESSGPSGSGLSHEASIGIGAGLGVGGLAMVVVVALLLIWRRRVSRRSSQELPTSSMPAQELIGDEPTRKVEMDSEQSPASDLEARGTRVYAQL